MTLVQSISRSSVLRRLRAVRPFSSPTEARGVETETSMFDGLEVEAEQEFGYEEWLKSTKAALAKSKGRYWLGKDRPFPYNPAFVPRPVLSNIAKTRIFEAYKQDPKTNDHRALSSKFKVSIERVKAIIRQKEFELELAQKGKVVDSSYIEQIESNLECVSIADDLKASDAVSSVSLPIRPIFVNVPEGRNFDFNDAKAALLAHGINPKIPSIMKEKNTELPVSNVKVTEISKSEFERSKSKFVFVDTSRKDEVHIVVRDTDGTLRTPTSEELQSAIKKTWNRNAPKKLSQ